MLGMVYLVAFTVAFRQNGPLLGDQGLLPVSLWMKRARDSMRLKEAETTWALLRRYPSVLW